MNCTTTETGRRPTGSRLVRAGLRRSRQHPKSTRCRRRHPQCFQFHSTPHLRARSRHMGLPRQSEKSMADRWWYSRLRVWSALLGCNNDYIQLCGSGRGWDRLVTTFALRRNLVADLVGMVVVGRKRYGHRRSRGAAGLLIKPELTRLLGNDGTRNEEEAEGSQKNRSRTNECRV